MALNIKNDRVEAVLDEVVAITGETKTEAVRAALEERRTRLTTARLGQDRARLRRDFLEREVWSRIPVELLDKPPLSKEEEEELLGLGPAGV